MIMMLDILEKISEEVRNAIALIPDADARGEELCIGADGTPTTQIDKIAENVVLGYIQRNGIELNVLSEEIGFVDNGFKDTLVLDPIDGTTNSVIGVPMYTISMAVGKNSLSNVHTAYVENLVTGDKYTARKGKGAFLNGKKIQSKKVSDPKNLLMMIYLGNGAARDAFALAKKVKSSRAYGCASLEMILVATGMADGFLMNAENNRRSIRVIDIAASYLILKEAGGDVFNLDGTKFDMPFDLDHRSNFLAVGNTKVFNMVMSDACCKSSKEKVVYGIYANMSIPSSVKIAKKVASLLKGETVMFDTAVAEALGKEGVPIDEMGADIVIAIGGDGTILRALQNNEAMIIGINAGGIGFLAGIEPDQVERGIKRLRAGDYTVEKRFKLRTVYNGEVLEDAVNEAVIHTDAIAKIRQFRVYVDEHLATDLRADGFMISTPTGSTCYAMSLGAPIIDPRVHALALVPMAAFKFTAKPMIIPASSKVTVETVLDKGCILVVDGQKEYNIPGGSKLEFTRSMKYARFIMFDNDFYGRIKEKLVNVL